MSTWLHNLLIVGGPAVVLTLALGRWLAPKWIDQLLQIRLERFKAEQQKEIERLRHLLSSRISRIHEKEFDVLPTAWLMLHEAHGAAFYALAGQKQLPDLDKLNDAEFEQFLIESRLSEVQRNALRKASDRRGYYSEAMSWVDLREAEKKEEVFHNYLVQHRIFMTEELRTKFGAVDESLMSAMVNFRVGKQCEDWEMRRSGIGKVTQLKDKIDEVEAAVQKRLRYEES